MTPAELFAILDAAGVSTSDFSRLTGITRTSLQRWKVNGAHIRDRLRFRIAEDKARRIATATSMGRLPLRETYTWSERTAALKRIIG